MGLTSLNSIGLTMMKNRYVALVLAIIPLGFGIHKFYLGNPFAGILYILFSWSGIPQFLSVIDVIRLATMEEYKFNAIYNHQLPPSPVTVTAIPSPEERLDVAIIKTCSAKVMGATMSECVIATGEDPHKVKETIDLLCRQGFLLPDNREGDYAVVYKSI